MFVCALCCGQGLWSPGSEMKDISHVAGLVGLLSQHAATNQGFLPLSYPDSLAHHPVSARLHDKEKHQLVF